MSASTEPSVGPEAVRVLCVGLPAGEAVGGDPTAVDVAAWQVEPAADIAAARSRLATTAYDAVLWVDPPAEALAAADFMHEWPFSDVAFVVVSGDERLRHQLDWLQAGAEEVLQRGELSAPGGWPSVRRAIERKRIEVRGRHEHTTDPMTGLVNRQQLVEHLSHLLAVRAREPAPLGLVVLHVTGMISAEHADPAEAARLVRRKIAVRLRAGVRASDVVASLNPETYAVMLSSIDASADTAAVAFKLAMALRHPFTVAGQTVSVTVEAGSAVAPEDGTEPDALIRAATMRMSAPALNPRVAANDP